MIGIKENFISVIIPVYNESKRIVPSLMAIIDYCKKTFNMYEIIIIDDGSTDNTKEVLSEIVKNNNIKFITYEKNKGKGYAVRQGILVSKGNFILITDADLSTPIEEVEKLLIFCESCYDVVIGSRWLKESEILIKQPWWREVMGRVFNIIVRSLLKLEFMDTQCGFKLLRGEVGKYLAKRAIIDRFAFDVEILYLSKKEGFKIKEVPVKWLNSKDSKVKPIRDSLNCLIDVIKIKFIRRI